MPSGTTHAKATLVLGTLATTYTFVVSPEAGAQVAAGFLVSLWVNPDLDLNTPFPRGKPHKWPLWLYFYPYSRVMKHRSFWSHGPGVSTLLRVLYLAPIFLMTEWPELPFFLALGLSDGLHTFLDLSVSYLKSLTRR